MIPITADLDLHSKRDGHISDKAIASIAMCFGVFHILNIELLIFAHYN